MIGVVGDEDSVRKIMVRVLQAAGFAARAFASGADAQYFLTAAVRTKAVADYDAYISADSLALPQHGTSL